MSILPRLAVIAITLVTTHAALADLGPGETVAEGVLADVTVAGFDFAEEQVKEMVPSDIPFEAIAFYEEPFGGCSFAGNVEDLEVHVTITTLEITPMDDVLQLDVTAQAWVNSEWDPLFLDLDGGDILCWGLDAECYVWTDPMTFTLSLQIGLGVVIPNDGSPPYLAATVQDFTHNIDTAIDSQAVHLDCWLQGLLDFLEFFGVDVIDLILDSAMEEVWVLLDELPQTIEEAIEDGSESLSYIDTVDLAGVPLDIALVPHAIYVTPEGLRVTLDSAFDAPQAECIAAYDPGTSPLTNHPPPEPDGTATYHVRALVADDLIASAIYAVWRGGVLCYTVDQTTLSGFTIDTSLLSLMVDKDDRHLLERIWLDEPQPTQIRTDPREVPEVRIDGAHDIEATVSGLGLHFFTMTQDRLSRTMSVDVNVDATVDLDAPGDGSVGIDLAVDAENLAPVVTYDEVVGDLSEQIEDNFGGIMGGLVDFVLDYILGDPSLGVMQLAGIGIAQLDVGPDGDGLDFLAAEATFDVVKPECAGDLSAFGCSTDQAIGCGEDGDMGCSGDSMGCSGDGGGCSDPFGCSGDDDDSAATGDDDDSAADPCGCQSGCDGGSCGSSCDSRGPRSGDGIANGCLLLMAACVGTLVWQRRR